jgi:hypothetical protein
LRGDGPADRAHPGPHRTSSPNAEGTLSDGADRTGTDSAGVDGSGKLYLGLCLVALVLMVWGLNEIRPGDSSIAPLFPFVLGVGALFFRLPTGAVLLLIALTVLISVDTGRESAIVLETRVPSAASKVVQQIVMAVSSLLFVVAYCRNLGLESGIFPAERRKAPPEGIAGWWSEVRPPSRSAGVVHAREIWAIAIAVPVFSLIGNLLWAGLNRLPPPRGYGAEYRVGDLRLLLVFWIVGIVGWTASVLIGYLDSSRASPRESLQFLQDQLWQETRQEQSRVNRWLVRFRLRRQQREENK